MLAADFVLMPLLFSSWSVSLPRSDVLELVRELKPFIEGPLEFWAYKLDRLLSLIALSDYIFWIGYYARYMTWDSFRRVGLSSALKVPSLPKSPAVFPKPFPDCLVGD